MVDNNYTNNVFMFYVCPTKVTQVFFNNLPQDINLHISHTHMVAAPTAVTKVITASVNCFSALQPTITDFCTQYHQTNY
jgi:hypothetical protein